MHATDCYYSKPSHPVLWTSVDSEGRLCPCAESHHATETEWEFGKKLNVSTDLPYNGQCNNYDVIQLL